MAFQPHHPAQAPEPADLNALKKQQIDSYKELYDDQPLRTQTPWSKLRTYLEFKQLDHAIARLGGDLTGKTVLTICSGKGIESDYFAQAGATVTATDLSPESTDHIHERYPHITTLPADAENLPFEDNQFDIVAVRRGLHHLPRPAIGIYEMLRVTKHAAVLFEAQDNWVMRRLTAGKLLGILPHGGRYECHGNYVYRFSRRELEKIGYGMFINQVYFQAEWHHNNYVLENLHHKLCQNQIGFGLGRSVYNTLNQVFGRWGNNLLAIYTKTPLH